MQRLIAASRSVIIRAGERQDFCVTDPSLRSGAVGAGMDKLKSQVKGGLKDVFSGVGKKPAEKPDTTKTPQ
jgi:hypothetical protein